MAKEGCRLLLPPLVVKGARFFQKKLSSRYAPDVTLEYFPHAWEEFHPVQQTDGWNEGSVVAFERVRWEQFRRNLKGTGPLGFSHEHTDLTVVDSPWFHNIHMTFAYTLALAAHDKKSLSVLDFGGGLGYYHLIAKAALPQIHFDYHVREVPRMVAAGKILNPEVIWHGDDACLDQTYDMVLASGSLQYVHNWEEKLRQLCRATKGHLLLTRLTTVVHSPSFIAIQRAHHSEWLVWNLNYDAVLAVVRDSGLELLREFVIGDHFFIKGAPEEFVMRGWLFKATRS